MRRRGGSLARTGHAGPPCQGIPARFGRAGGIMASAYPATVRAAIAETIAAYQVPGLAVGVVRAGQAPAYHVAGADAAGQPLTLASRAGRVDHEAGDRTSDPTPGRCWCTRDRRAGWALPARCRQRGGRHHTPRSSAPYERLAVRSTGRCRAVSPGTRLANPGAGVPSNATRHNAEHAGPVQQCRLRTSGDHRRAPDRSSVPRGP